MDKNFWPQMSLAVVALIAGLVGAKAPGFEWITYLAGILFVFTFIIILWQAFFEKVITKWYSKYKNRKYLKSFDEKHWELLFQLNIITELQRELDSISWGNKRPIGNYPAEHIFNSIKAQFEKMPREYRIISSNLVIAEFIRGFDGWLSACDNLLKSGEIFYDTEARRNKIVKLVHRYDTAIAAYRDLITKINEQLYAFHLTNIYHADHIFNWASSIKQPEVKEAKI